MTLVDIIETLGEPGPLTELEGTFPKISDQSLFENEAKSIARLDGMMLPRAVIDAIKLGTDKKIARLDHSYLLSEEEYDQVDTIVTDALRPWLALARLYVIRAVVRAHVAGGVSYDSMLGFASLKLHVVSTPGFDQLEILQRPLKAVHGMLFPSSAMPQISIVGVVNLMYGSPLMLDARLRLS